MEYSTTGAYWPWNLSTVPTRALSGSAARIAATWVLYGATEFDVVVVGHNATHEGWSESRRVLEVWNLDQEDGD
jgi:hypothetical protein